MVDLALKHQLTNCTEGAGWGVYSGASSAVVIQCTCAECSSAAVGVDERERDRQIERFLICSVGG